MMMRHAEAWRYGAILHRRRERIMFVRWLSEYTRSTPPKGPTEKFEGIRLVDGLTSFHRPGGIGVYMTTGWRTHHED